MVENLSPGAEGKEQPRICQRHISVDAKEPSHETLAKLAHDEEWSTDLFRRTAKVRKRGPHEIYFVGLSTAGLSHCG
jgi:hypothetical protein